MMREQRAYVLVCIALELSEDPQFRCQIGRALDRIDNCREARAVMKNPPPRGEGLSVPVRASASPPVPPAELTPREPFLSTNIHDAGIL